MTIKNLVSSKIDGTQELEIEVDNFERCHLILKELGYEPKGYQENRRRHYVLNGVDIVLIFGHYSYLFGIEGSSEEAVYKTLEALGFSKETATTMDVDGVYKSYGHNLEEIFDLCLEEERR